MFNLTGLRPEPRQRTNVLWTPFLSMYHLPQRKMMYKNKEESRGRQSFGWVWGRAPIKGGLSNGTSENFYSDGTNSGD